MALGDPAATAPPQNTSARRTRARVRGTARRVVVFCLGTLLILVGTAMLVLPGPAFVVIPAGIALLATEFPWAHRLLQRMKAYVRHLMHASQNAFGRGNADK